MIRRNQKLINILNVLSDIVLIFCSYVAAVYVRFEILKGEQSDNMLERKYLLIAGMCSLMAVSLYYMLRLYAPRRYRRTGSIFARVTVANGFSILGLMSIFYLWRWYDGSRLAVGLFWLFSSALVAGKHSAGRAVLRYYRSRGYNQRHVILVGNGYLAHQYVQDLRREKTAGLTLDGYVSAVPRKELGRCLGRYEDLDAILNTRQIDEVVVALEPHESQYMKSILVIADREGVRASVIPFYNEYIPAHPSIDVLGDTKLINVRATPLDNVLWAAIKRALDIVGALAMIVLTGPVMLGVAVGVKLSSPGPILFRQERVGKGKKTFTMLKFRSMRVTGSEETGWTTDADPRKTRFGTFIRKYSLDELPQAFNVLVGQMSLVGPRPEIPYHVDHFKHEIPRYLVRQQVRPGITGWAQVHGLRGDTSIPERVKYDIWYIDNWSLGLDLRILLRTVFGGWVNREKAPKKVRHKSRPKAGTKAR